MGWWIYPFRNGYCWPSVKETLGLFNLQASIGEINFPRPALNANATRTQLRDIWNWGHEGYMSIRHPCHGRPKRSGSWDDARDWDPVHQPHWADVLWRNMRREKIEMQAFGIVSSSVSYCESLYWSLRLQLWLDDVITTLGEIIWVQETWWKKIRQKAKENNKWRPWKRGA